MSKSNVQMSDLYPTELKNKYGQLQPETTANYEKYINELTQSTYQMTLPEKVVSNIVKQSRGKMSSMQILTRIHCLSDSP